nr:MAG TPA: hypothetical protein [Bacteriophage sp.]
MSCNCQEVAEKGKQKVEESIAMQVVKDSTKNSKRWFTIAIVILCMWLATIGGFVYFLNQYNFESYEYTQDGQGTNNINNNIGGSVYNGADVENP